MYSISGNEVKIIAAAFSFSCWKVGNKIVWKRLFWYSGILVMLALLSTLWLRSICSISVSHIFWHIKHNLPRLYDHWSQFSNPHSFFFNLYISVLICTLHLCPNIYIYIFISRYIMIISGTNQSEASKMPTIITRRCKFVVDMLFLICFLILPYPLAPIIIH